MAANRSEVVRKDVVSQAVSFLQSPKVRESSLERQRSFLESKGMTAAEVDEAIREVFRSGEEASRRADDHVATAERPQGTGSSARSEAISDSAGAGAASPRQATASRGQDGHSVVPIKPQRVLPWSQLGAVVAVMVTAGAGFAFLLRAIALRCLRAWLLDHGQAQAQAQAQEQGQTGSSAKGRGCEELTKLGDDRKACVSKKKALSPHSVRALRALAHELRVLAKEMSGEGADAPFSALEARKGTGSFLWSAEHFQRQTVPVPGSSEGTSLGPSAAKSEEDQMGQHRVLGTWPSLGLKEGAGVSTVGSAPQCAAAGVIGEEAAGAVEDSMPHLEHCRSGVLHSARELQACAAEPLISNLQVKQQAWPLSSAVPSSGGASLNSLTSRGVEGVTGREDGEDFPGGQTGGSSSLPAPVSQSYMDILEMVRRGETPPGTKDIDDKPPNPGAVPSASLLAPRQKPWEKRKGQE